MNEKKWYESKLTWLGIITTIIGALQLIQVQVEAAAYSPDDFIGVAIGILTVILRVWFTDTPIKNGRG